MEEILTELYQLMDDNYNRHIDNHNKVINLIKGLIVIGATDSKLTEDILNYKLESY